MDEKKKESWKDYYRVHETTTPERREKIEVALTMIEMGGGLGLMREGFARQNKQVLIMARDSVDANYVSSAPGTPRASFPTQTIPVVGAINLNFNDIRQQKSITSALLEQMYSIADHVNANEKATEFLQNNGCREPKPEMKVLASAKQIDDAVKHAVCPIKGYGVKFSSEQVGGAVQPGHTPSVNEPSQQRR